MPAPSVLVPSAGDIVWVDFGPPFGHEQAGRRPAVVVSARSYNEVSSTIVLCPITRNVQDWPFKVLLPATEPIGGAVLVDQVRSVDRRVRILRRAGRLTDGTLASVRAMLATVLETSTLA